MLHSTVWHLKATIDRHTYGLNSSSSWNNEFNFKIYSNIWFLKHRPLLIYFWACSACRSLWSGSCCVISSSAVSCARSYLISKVGGNRIFKGFFFWFYWPIRYWTIDQITAFVRLLFHLFQNSIRLLDMRCSISTCTISNPKVCAYIYIPISQSILYYQVTSTFKKVYGVCSRLVYRNRFFFFDRRHTNIPFSIFWLPKY